MRSLPFLALVVSSPALAEIVYVPGHTNVVAIDQTAFSPDLSDKGTDVRGLKYDGLAPYRNGDTGRVWVGKSRQDWSYADAKPDGATEFLDAHFQNMTRGGLDCAPVAGMTVANYWATRLESARRLAMDSTSDMQAALGLAMDCNDVNSGMNARDNVGHFGTKVKDVGPGLLSYAMDRLGGGGGGYRSRTVAFTEADFRKEIDAGRPMIVTFTKRGAAIGHAVMAYGYELEDGKLKFLIVADSATSQGPATGKIRVPDGAREIGWQDRSMGDSRLLPGTDITVAAPDAIEPGFEAGIVTFEPPIDPVPEPASLIALSVGLIATARRRARK